MLQCSLWLRQPASVFAPTRLLSAPQRRFQTGGRRQQRVWRQPDIRQLRNRPSLNSLQSIMQLAQHNMPDPASQRQGHTYSADAQGALLSRPGGRPSRLRDAQATFHFKKQFERPRMNTKAFRKHYNSS